MLQKRYFGLFLGLCLLVLIGCTPSFLQFNKEIPRIQANENKAILVVLRPDIMPMSTIGSVYVDQKAVGGTYSESVLIQEIEPGEHLITNRTGEGTLEITFKKIVKLNFEAGKIYYMLHDLNQIPFTGVNIQASMMTQEEANQVFTDKSGKLSHVTVKPGSDRFKDLDDETFKDYQADYEAFAKNKPAEAKVFQEYKGY